MKKIFIAGMVVLGSMSLFACERTNTEGTTAREGVVVDRDSVATEYEVTETIVKYDTTTQTKTVDANTEEKKNNKNNR